MTLDPMLFSFLVTSAVITTGLAPLVLIGLLLRDWLRGELW